MNLVKADVYSLGLTVLEAAGVSSQEFKGWSAISIEENHKNLIEVALKEWEKKNEKVEKDKRIKGYNI